MYEFRSFDKVPKIVPSHVRNMTRVAFATDELIHHVWGNEERFVARLIHVVERTDKPTNRTDLAVINLDFGHQGGIIAVAQQLEMIDEEAFRRFGGPVQHVGLLIAATAGTFKNKRHRDKSMATAIGGDYTTAMATARMIRGISGMTHDGWRVRIDRDLGAAKCDGRIDLHDDSPDEMDTEMMEAIARLNAQLTRSQLHAPDRFTLDARAYADRTREPMVKRPKANWDTRGNITGPELEMAILLNTRKLGG